jgi:uncharacterized membrane protein YjjB (DUF3815 family)
MTELIQIITATVGSLGFGILFNIRGKRLIAVAIGGGVAWSLYLCFFALTGSLGISYFLISLILEIYGEIMARCFKCPAILFISPSLIPLVPGASLYYTMSHALSQDTDSFLTSALTTVIAAAALAVGIITGTILTKLITSINSRIKSKLKKHEHK